MAEAKGDDSSIYFEQVTYNEQLRFEAINTVAKRQQVVFVAVCLACLLFTIAIPGLPVCTTVLLGSPGPAIPGACGHLTSIFSLAAATRSLQRDA